MRICIKNNFEELNIVDFYNLNVELQFASLSG